MKKYNFLVASACIMMILSIGLSGCGDAGGSAKTEAPVRLVCEWDASSFASDVNTNGTFLEDTAPAIVSVFAVSPDFEDDSYLMSVMVTGYEIKYKRMDTGTEVPKTFVVNTSMLCELNNTLDLEAIICRASQKEMPPLSYLWQFGYEPSTGLTEIHTTCTMTVWGKTLAGKEVVSNEAHLPVHFADWATN